MADVRSHPLEFFDGVYVINLRSRPDRRREMASELRRIGFPEPRCFWIEAERPQSKGPFDSIGAHGCFMSHLCVLGAAAAAGCDRVLILEDDVDFEQSFNARMERIVVELGQQRWDMFYGGGITKSRQRHSEELAEVSPESGIVCAHFVALNGSGVIHRVHDYIRAQLTRPPGDPAGGPMHVDGSYSWARRDLRLKTLIADPDLCHQRSSASDIAAGGWRSSPVVRDALTLGRRIRRAMLRPQ